ncbi:MAG: hypothetical protein AAF063_34135 [Cyanobacteria bacterium J06643_5]
MSFKFSSRQSKQLESSFSLMNYVVNLQQHMTNSRLKQDLNYQSQSQLELLASRQKF